MTFLSRIFKKKEETTAVITQLTFKERIAALQNLPRFFKMVWQTSKWMTITNALLRLCLSAMPLAILYVGKLIVDLVISITTTQATVTSYLWKLVALEFGLAIVSDILSRGINLMDSLLGDLFSNHTSIKIINHAATLDLEQFENSTFYDKMERARQQTIGRTILLSQVFSQVQDLITMAFLAAGLLAFNPWLIVMLIVAIIPAFLGEAYFNDKTYALSRKQTPEKRELDYVRFLGASDDPAKEVKIVNLSGFIISRFKHLSNRFYAQNKKLTIRRTAWGALLAILGSAGYYSAYVFIIGQTVTGAITIGSLTFLAGSFRQLRGLMETILLRFNSVSQGAVYLQDFFDFFEIQPTIVTSTRPLPFPNPIKQGFTFDDVGFRYANSEKWANRHINFTLHPGEKIALVGENGAGKTTLVKLLARLYDPTEGRILLDGVDLKEYDLNELRIQIGVIFQDFIRYQMSVSQNIAVGNIIEQDNEELITESSKQSLAHTMIERLPQKYEQMLGRRFNNGIELSGGEWQKIALARAYMKDAQLLILDEPTAALDARAEYEVFQRFADLTKGKSAVLISHRFSTVRMADRIMVLENGHLIEMGNHQQLLEIDGRYAELFGLQAMGYR